MVHDKYRGKGIKVAVIDTFPGMPSDSFHEEFDGLNIHMIVTLNPKT